MTLEDFKKTSLPSEPGVYFFKKGKEVVYIGKATSLNDRVRSYFSNELNTTRGPLLVKMVLEADSISYKKTSSVLEALILEAIEIRKYQPIYNSKEKDNKSYNYVVITNELFPRVLTIRERELFLQNNNKSKIYRSIFGPFPHGTQLKEALKIIRKILPFRDKCTPISELKNAGKAKACFNRQIGMCPGVCTGEISQKEYISQVKNIELFFSGKRKEIEKNFIKDMKLFSKVRNFERAQEIKDQLFALQHIRDVSLLKRDNLPQSKKIFRIEAYDIAHTAGKETVGVMAVVESGELNKNEYRKFKIRGDGKVSIDDTKNLKEILIRRLNHTEWMLPNLIVVDGGRAQINIVKDVLNERNLSIDLVSVLKDERHKPKEIVGIRNSLKAREQEILLANNEAHRFAINYHRNLLRPLKDIRKNR